jgi:hypothetical protein
MCEPIAFTLELISPERSALAHYALCQQFDQFQIAARHLTQHRIGQLVHQNDFGAE